MKWKLLLAFSAVQYLASACSCVKVSQKDARAAAYAVFDGTVTDIHYFEDEKDREISSRVLVTFKIAKSWKGHTLLSRIPRAYCRPKTSQHS